MVELKSPRVSFFTGIQLSNPITVKKQIQIWSGSKSNTTKMVVIVWCM